MPAPVYIDFVARGIPEFQRAMRTVQDGLVKFETGSTQTTQRQSRQRVSTADREAKEKVRAMLRADAEVRRAIERGVREAERAEKAKARAATQSARERVRAMERADNEMRRIQERSVREAERAEAEKTRAAAQWVARRERELAKQRAGNVAIANQIVGAAGSGFKSGIARAAQATQQVAGVVLGLGGGMSVADSVQRSVNLSGMAADLANSGYIPNGDNAANRTKRSSKDLLGAARATAIRTGLSTEDTLKGLQEFVGKSGDLDTGLKVMGQLAELSTATGASFHDVAGAAGDLMSQLGDMPDKGEAVMSIMRGIAGQGKLGAVEMKNLASQMAKLAASAGQFGGKAVDNILMMGMLAQEARAGGGASSATMAATSVAGFTNTLKTPARIKEFKAAGVELFDENKMLRDPREIIMQSLQKTGGDPEQMKKLFANVMGERAVTSYANAYRKAGGGEAGTAVVRGMFKRQMEGAAMTKEDVAKAFADRMAEDDKRIAQLREKFDRAVAEQLIPKFVELIPVIEKMIPVFIDLNAKALPAFVELIKTIADFAEKNKGLIADIAAHPIGTLIAAEVTKSVAGAGIGAAVKAAIERAIGGAGGGGGGGGPGGVPGGNYGKAAALGVASGVVAGNAVLKYSAGEERAQDIAAKVRAYQAGDTDRGMSPEAAAIEVANAKKRLENTGVIDQVGNIIASPVSDQASQNYAQYKSDQALVDDKALQELIGALRDNANATRNSGGPGGPARDTNIVNRN